MVKKNLLLLSCLVMVLTVSAKPKKVQTPAVSVGELRTEHMVNPMSVDTPTPRMSWQIVSAQNEVKQTAYHLIVSSSLAKAMRNEGDLWDVTENTDQSQWVSYAGKTLRSDTRCYWRVQVTTTKGASEWSDVGMFNIGLLYVSDWSGQWIGLDRANPWDKEDEHSQLTSRYLRTDQRTGYV